MGKKPNLTDFLGKNAKEYEINKNLRKLQKETTIRSIELLNEDTKIPIDSMILDIGCGTGWSMEILKEYGYKNVIGIDISEDMLKIARSKGLEVYKANLIDSLPFSNEYFNGIISISVINFIVEDIKSPFQYNKNCKSAASEIYRVLKPGGKAVIQFFKDLKFQNTLHSLFKNQGFSGFIVIDDQNLRKEKRFFVLKKD
ncbi:MAG: class I SAM-dependent methyltransferase [Candidatus Helarchaeota archaeon]